MVNKRFDKRSSDSAVTRVYSETLITWDKFAIKSEIISYQESTIALQKLHIFKFEKRKAYSSFKNNICVPDPVDLQLISKYNNGLRFWSCIINIFSKYLWVIPLKDKKGITITISFQ